MKDKVKVRVKRRQQTQDLITLDPDQRQAIIRIFSILQDDVLAVAWTCLSPDDGVRWTREQLNSYCADPVQAGYCIRRDGEKYLMTRLNFPDPPIRLETWLECNPLVRKCPIRLE